MRTLPDGIPPTDQVALVVRDLDAAMAAWIALGIGPWRVYTFDPERLASMSYLGREVDHAMRVALCAIGPISYELIEPIAGPTVYADHLATHGEGLHHLGYYVDDIDAAIAAMEARGFAAIQTGRGVGLDGDGAYAYFDTEAALGCVLEAIRRPRRMREPDGVFPDGA